MKITSQSASRQSFICGKALNWQHRIFFCFNCNTMQSTTASFQKTRLAPRWWAFMLLLAGTLLFPSCKDDEKIFKEGPVELSADVAYDWIDLQLELTKSTPGFTAPVAARAFAYTGLGLYESLRYGIQGSRSMAGQVSDFSATVLPEAEATKAYNWGAVANTTMAALLRGLYPNATDANKAAITRWRKNTRPNTRMKAPTRSTSAPSSWPAP
jgi:hypothetical protein